MRVDTRHFDCFLIDFLISVLINSLAFWLFLTGVQAVMNDIGWDWARAVMNKANWHSAAHYKNNSIGLDW